MKRFFYSKNNIYTLKPKFISQFQDWLRKTRLAIYKRKKVKDSKTHYDRQYFLRFKIKITDEHNGQLSDAEYDMVVPAKAAFFSKMKLEKKIKEKVEVQIIDVEEMSDEDYGNYINSKNSFIEKNQATKP